jgi:hypothetical protein
MTTLLYSYPIALSAIGIGIHFFGTLGLFQLGVSVPMHALMLTIDLLVVIGLWKKTACGYWLAILLYIEQSIMQPYWAYQSYIKGLGLFQLLVTSPYLVGLWVRKEEKMAHFIIGASGSGKTACKEELRSLLVGYDVHDFDDIGVPSNADKKWRQETTELWIRRIVDSEIQGKFCLLGQMVLGEILACPSAKKLEHINAYLLDCSDIIRVKRLKARNSYGVNQDTLNWATWLRMHCHDPQWEQRVIKDSCWSGMDFSGWDTLHSWNEVANVRIIDTSSMSIAEVAKQLSYAVQSGCLGAKIPGRK